MVGISLATAQARLDMWLEAEERVMKKQTYTINGRSLTYANLGEIRQSIEYWESRVNRASRGEGPRIRYGVKH